MKTNTFFIVTYKTKYNKTHETFKTKSEAIQKIKDLVLTHDDNEENAGDQTGNTIELKEIKNSGHLKYDGINYISDDGKISFFADKNDQHISTLNPISEASIPEIKYTQRDKHDFYDGYESHKTLDALASDHISFFL